MTPTATPTAPVRISADRPQEGHRAACASTDTHPGAFSQPAQDLPRETRSWRGAAVGEKPPVREVWIDLNGCRVIEKLAGVVVRATRYRTSAAAMQAGLALEAQILGEWPRSRKLRKQALARGLRPKGSVWFVVVCSGEGPGSVADAIR